MRALKHVHSALTEHTQQLLLCGHTFSVTSHKRTHTHPFNGPFSRTTRVSRYQKGKPNLDFTEARESGSGVSWAICKSASRSRQIAMPVPHHSSFLQAGCLSCRPTNSVKALKAHFSHVRTMQTPFCSELALLTSKSFRGPKAHWHWLFCQISSPLQFNLSYVTYTGYQLPFAFNTILQL